jgi:hypothetical protein
MSKAYEVSEYINSKGEKHPILKIGVNDKGFAKIQFGIEKAKALLEAPNLIDEIKNFVAHALETAALKYRV